MHPALENTAETTYAQFAPTVHEKCGLYVAVAIIMARLPFLSFLSTFAPESHKSWTMSAAPDAEALVRISAIERKAPC